MTTLSHLNSNVLGLEKSLAFYKEALGLELVRERDAGDGSFELVYLGDGVTGSNLELAWLRDKEKPYNLGEYEPHLAFCMDEFDEIHRHHGEIGCTCYENPGMGTYLIAGPDDYWVEIIPAKR